MANTPEESEIETQFNEALVYTSEGQTQYPAMSYESGIRDALSWVLGEREEPPMGDID